VAEEAQPRSATKVQLDTAACLFLRRWVRRANRGTLIRRGENHGLLYLMAENPDSERPHRALWRRRRKLRHQDCHNHQLSRAARGVAFGKPVFSFKLGFVRFFSFFFVWPGTVRRPLHQARFGLAQVPSPTLAASPLQLLTTERYVKNDAALHFGAAGV